MTIKSYFKLFCCPYLSFCEMIIIVKKKNGLRYDSICTKILCFKTYTYLLNKLTFNAELLPFCYKVHVLLQTMRPNTRHRMALDLDFVFFESLQLLHKLEHVSMEYTILWKSSVVSSDNLSWKITGNSLSSIVSL